MFLVMVMVMLLSLGGKTEWALVLGRGWWRGSALLLLLRWRHAKRRAVPIVILIL